MWIEKVVLKEVMASMWGTHTDEISPWDKNINK